MIAVINRLDTFGTLDGVYKNNEEIHSIVRKHIKQGTATLLIDTDFTLMYRINDQEDNKSIENNQHV